MTSTTPSFDTTNLRRLLAEVSPEIGWPAYVFDALVDITKLCEWLEQQPHPAPAVPQAEYAPALYNPEMDRLEFQVRDESVVHHRIDGWIDELRNRSGEVVGFALNNPAKFAEHYRTVAVPQAAVPDGWKPIDRVDALPMDGNPFIVIDQLNRGEPTKVRYDGDRVEFRHWLTDTWVEIEDYTHWILPPPVNEGGE